MLSELKLVKLLDKDLIYLKDVYKIEYEGMQIDPEFIGRSRMALTKDLKILEQQLFDSIGHELNYRSHVQLSKALYEEMGISKPINPFADADGIDRSRFADKGKYNKTMTSSFILVEKAHHPLGGLINSIRETAKLIKTLSQWLDLVDSTGLLHTNFNITGTRTGRLSSSKPNLQNVPSMVRNVFTAHETIREEEYNLRNAFVVPPGYKMLSIDYKQMEIFYFAIISQEPAMMEFIKTGKDIHSQIAMKVWGVADPTHRKWSKQISLGLLYGMTTGTLQFKLGMTRPEAQKVTNEYWNEFPRIRPWLFEVIKECKTNGYLTYWSGRLWREETEEHMYKGANALIQGGMADMLSIAEIRVARWLEKNPIGRIVSIVHDEFLFYIQEDKIEKASLEIAKIMQVPDLFNIPFNTEIKIGTTYGNLKEPQHGE
jgi:DNA polymerase-1